MKTKKLTKEILQVVLSYVHLARGIQLDEEDDYNEFSDAVEEVIKNSKRNKRSKKFICPICGGTIVATKPRKYFVNPYTGHTDIETQNGVITLEYECSVNKFHCIPQSLTRKFK